MNSSTKTDYSVSMIQANIYSLLFAIPLVILLAAAYVLRWGMSAGGDLSGMVAFLAATLVGLVAHELIHAATWMLVGKKSRSVIRFGIDRQTFSPYAHCTEPMEVNAYRVGGFMPALLLGILPALIAILTGSGWLMIYGLLFTAAAGGDMLVLWLLRGVQAGRRVEDHPTRAGCYVLDEETK